MSQTQKLGKGGRRKIGRWKKKPCNQRYQSEAHRVKNKVRRVWKSNGRKAAEMYAREHPACAPVLVELMGSA